MESFKRLDGITLDPSTLSLPMADKNVHPFGLKATVKGWLGVPDGKPDHTFVLTEFVDPDGRKIFFRLKDPSVNKPDELFGKEIHENTVYPARWASMKSDLNPELMKEIPDRGLESALFVKPARGSYDCETAEGEIAGRPAWMSVSQAMTGSRHIEFRVYDKKYRDGACAHLVLSVLYLDKGDINLNLLYDSSDTVPRLTHRKPGAYKPGGSFNIGNTGTIKRHDFELRDARFSKYLLKEGTDFRLISDKDVDFVILGAFLKPALK